MLRIQGYDQVNPTEKLIKCPTIADNTELLTSVLIASENDETLVPTIIELGAKVT